MPPRSKQSLAQRNPKRWDIVALWLISTGLLFAGYVLPVMRTEKLIFWDDSYSLLQGVLALIQQKHFALALILFVFSVIFPVAKLGALAVLWFKPVDDEKRRNLLAWTSALGKWSMLDVFVVAIIVVISQFGGLIEASARIGVYVFAAAIACSIITAMFVERIASKS